MVSQFFYNAAAGCFYIQGSDAAQPALCIVGGTLSVDGIEVGGVPAGGTVTSVALSAPAIFSVGGSPVTTTGTLALSLATQAANVVWAGPTTGSAAAPTFRALVAADVPNLDAAKITSGALAVAQGGTGAATANANVAFAGPTSGGAAAPSFRALVEADVPSLSASKVTSGEFDAARIPDLAASKITSGQLAIAQGGTGAATAADNAVFIGPASGGPSAPSFRTLVTADLPADGVTYAKMQNVSATARVLGRKTGGAGDVEECTVSEVLDFVGSPARGMVLYRNASAWVALSPGDDGEVLTTHGAGADPTWEAAPGGGGSGTVTTVSVVTANGVSGSVANASTTPAVTLTLGDITPTSVNASGTVAGSNLSGTNTGDQDLSGLALKATTITAGTGLSGGGDLSTNRTISLPNTGTADTYTKVTTDAQGRVSSGTTLSASDIPSLAASKITSGQLAIAQGGTGAATTSANFAFIGPASGGAAAPSFRALVQADIPSLDASAVGSGQFAAARIPNLDAAIIVTGQLAVARGGTGASTASANVVFAGPTSGGAAAPSFRALVEADVPSLSASKVTSGQLAIARGGTGAETTDANKVFAGPTSGGAAAPSFRVLVAGDVPTLAASKVQAPGSSGQVVYNASNALAGSSSLTFDSSSGMLAAAAIAWTTFLKPAVRRLDMSGNVTLSDSDAAIQAVDPNGSNRDINLYTPTAVRNVEVIHRGSANTVAVKAPGGSTLATLSAGDSAGFLYDGTAWIVH